MTTRKYSIASLQAEKLNVQKQLDKSKSIISDNWTSLFAPTEADTKMQYFVNQAEKAIFIYDGVMFGYKLIKRLGNIKNIFQRRKR